MEKEVPKFLYHGTSMKAALDIFEAGAILPPASSPELAKRYQWPKDSAEHLPDQRYVYLIPDAFRAIEFGFVRTLGLKWKRGKYVLNRFNPNKHYENVVMLEVNTELLDPSLYRDSTLYKGEIAYEGEIPLGKRGRFVEFPMTRELNDFAFSAEHPELLKRYVGMDLTKHFQGRTREYLTGEE